MSGHSKWSTIKRKKAAADSKRGKIFTKLIKEIQVAAKMGGGDQDSNSRLRNAIDAAKSANMPLANVEKAIKKGTGDLEGVNYEEHVYEAYGPGGVAILLETMTDNKNRTVSELRHEISKHGGNLATNGSVAWMFEQKGKIVVKTDTCSEDDLFLLVSDGGAEDLTSDKEFFEVTTNVSSFQDVKNILEENNIKIEEANLEMIPKNMVKVDEDNATKILKLMEILEEHEDVQKVFSNFDIDEEIIEKL